ncbi:Hypothetical protein NTJ_02152 [Nesidiocoris tenuis]|uniref:Uncharacterized protein n=1 Tax=Nesidiocoris tenuis TaxID=355587 RepID=A0ABN7AAQ5_9HEMI|nr:Hypothetical protein NTJ_02152 [Nesidiocoris tenuis]
MIALSFVALAVLATANAYPVLNDDVTKWGSDFVLGGNRIQLGLGWKLDGTVSAGAKMWAGNTIPVAAAISSNLNNLNNVEYEVGAGGVLNNGNVLTNGNVVVAGNNNGKLKYAVSAALPGTGQSISGSIVGDHAEVKQIGVSVGNSLDSLSASVELDQFKPQAANIDFGSSRTY